MNRPMPWSWVALGGAAVGAWIALAAAGGGVLDVAGLSVSVSASGAAAAGGAAMLAGSCEPPRGWSLGAALSGMLLLPLAVAPAASGEDARPLVLVLALVAALGVTAGGRHRNARLRAVGLAGIGTALLGAAVLSAEQTSHALAPSGTPFAASMVAGAVFLVLAGAGGSVEVPALKPLLVVGLLAGLVGASAIGDVWVPLLVGAAAVGVAGVRPTTAVALFAIAAAALPGAQPAATLIAAGAVVAMALDREWAVVAALPGMIALVDVLTFPSPPAPRVVIGAGAVALCALITTDLFARRTEPASTPDGSRLATPVDLAALPGLAPRRAERHRIPALVVAAWVLAAPGSWSWAGDAGLGDYDTGAARALAVAAVVMTALASADRLAAMRRSRMST